MSRVDTGIATGGRFTLRGVGVELPSTSGTKHILSGVDLDVSSGEVVGIVGRSGSGKTTLMRVFGGLLPLSAGSVTLDDTPVKSPPRGVITVFQDYGSALLPWRTVERNVALGLEKDLKKADRAARVAEAVALVELSGREKEMPWRLSGGMQQRVQIARALAIRPRVLLMDEPFGALDAMTRAALQDELLRVKRLTGATIIFVTHDVEEAVYLSDRVVVVGGSPGRIVESLETGLGESRHQVATRESAQFLSVRHRLSDALAGGDHR
jgi:NitT/TauT family transport system ATP-binding protein